MATEGAEAGEGEEGPVGASEAGETWNQHTQEGGPNFPYAGADQQSPALQNPDSDQAASDRGHRELPDRENGRDTVKETNATNPTWPNPQSQPPGALHEPEGPDPREAQPRAARTPGRPQNHTDPNRGYPSQPNPDTRGTSRAPACPPLGSKIAALPSPSPSPKPSPNGSASSGTSSGNTAAMPCKGGQANRPRPSCQPHAGPQANQCPLRHRRAHPLQGT